MKALMTGEHPVIFGDGEQSRDFTYIENVVDANMRAAETKRGVGQVVNFATGQRITLSKLLNLLREITDWRSRASRISRSAKG